MMTTFVLMGAELRSRHTLVAMANVGGTSSHGMFGHDPCPWFNELHPVFSGPLS